MLNNNLMKVKYYYYYK